MKRTPLTRHTPLRFRSATRAAQMRVYAPRAAEFLAEHPWCQFPHDCGQPSTEVHHKRGRIGALLLDDKHWAALCRAHHKWVTEHPRAALEMGVSELRIGGAA